MSITGATLVQDAMLQATIIGLDQQIPDAYAQVALRRFNRMKDSWANIRDLIFATTTDSFTMSPSVAQYSTTLLAGGRPTTIDSMTVVLSNITYEVVMRDEQWYNDISYKPVDAIPNNCYYQASMSDGVMNFYPRPYAAFTCNVVRTDPLVGNITLQSVLSLPPGYDKAFVDSLAEDIWPTFKGMRAPIPEDIKRMAMQAREVLGVTNYEAIEMETPFDGRQNNLSNSFLYKGF